MYLFVHYLALFTGYGFFAVSAVWALSRILYLVCESVDRTAVRIAYERRLVWTLVELLRHGARHKNRVATTVVATKPLPNGEEHV